jgi:hypothetical protein
MLQPTEGQTERQHQPPPLQTPCPTADCAVLYQKVPIQSASSLKMLSHHKERGKVAALANDVWRLSLELQVRAPKDIRASLQQLAAAMNQLDTHTQQLQEVQPPHHPEQTSLSTVEGRKTKKLFTDRMCAHCGTQFTSQWRTGPIGPSTFACSLPLVPPLLANSFRCVVGVGCVTRVELGTQGR